MTTDSGLLAECFTDSLTSLHILEVRESRHVEQCIIRQHFYVPKYLPRVLLMGDTHFLFSKPLTRGALFPQNQMRKRSVTIKSLVPPCTV